MPVFTVVTNDLRSTFSSHPLVYRTVNLDYDFSKPEVYPTIFLVEGLDNAEKFGLKREMQIGLNYCILPNKVYWIPDMYNEIEVEKIMWQILKSVLSSTFNIVNNWTLKMYQENIIYYKHVPSVVFENGDKISILAQRNLIQFDLNILSFLEKKSKEEIKKEIVKPFEGLYFTYDEEPSIFNCQIKQRKVGIIEQKQSFKYAQSYYEYLTFKYEDYEKIDYNNFNLFGVFVCDNLFKNSMVLSTQNEPDTDILLFETQKYFSQVDVGNNIDTLKYNDLNFPIVKNRIVFDYHSIYTATGRIFTKTDGKYTSLQTLPKNKRDAVIAEKYCHLIEFDFKNFEFDIILQKVGFSFDKIKDIDFHLEVIKDIVPGIVTDSFLELYTEDDFRIIGKQVNYSLTYGSVLDKVVETLKETLEEKFEQKGVKEDLAAYFEYFRNRLNKNVYLRKILEFRDEFIKTKELFFDFNSNTSQRNLVYNHFGRIIKVEKSHALLNNYIQSTAADMINLKISKIANLFKKEKIDERFNKMLLQNHDSILLQMSDKVLGETTVFEQIINEILLAPEKGLYGRVRYGFGENWKQLS